jgi:hypothetical protein
MFIIAIIVVLVSWSVPQNTAQWHTGRASDIGRRRYRSFCWVSRSPVWMCGQDQHYSRTRVHVQVNDAAQTTAQIGHATCRGIPYLPPAVGY